MENNEVASTRASFPIVGIGASAGGLVALEEFLSHTPPKLGIAYVVVQHLDPDRAGMLVELLQRHTPMPVREVLDQMHVEPDHVNRVYRTAPSDSGVPAGPDDVAILDKAIAVLRAQSGHDFSQYKKSTLLRRIERRMALHQLVRPTDYLRYRTHENRIDGLVITFSDTSVSKLLELELSATRAALAEQMPATAKQGGADALS